MGATRDLAKRFWEKVQKTDTCWNWTACMTWGGYGRIGHAGKQQLAHRVSWMLEHGEFPELCVLHRCDNRRCVNPAHLFLGTYLDNSRDCVAKGRRPDQRRHKHPRAALSVLDSYLIQLAYRLLPVTGTQLSEAWGVSEGPIWRILHGKHWTTCAL
jgi:hypothetical protein